MILANFGQDYERRLKLQPKGICTAMFWIKKKDKGKEINWEVFKSASVHLFRIKIKIPVWVAKLLTKPPKNKSTGR